MTQRYSEPRIDRLLRALAALRPALAAIGLLLGIAWTSSYAWGALEPAQVLILVNRDVPVSSGVAKMYQKLRAIPDGNVLRLPLGTSRQIAPEQYWRLAGQPIRKYLEDHPDIHCVLTTSGVPYTILAPGGSDQGAAFDNELAAVLREEPGSQKRHQPNPLFLQGSNPSGVTDPRLLNMVYVARLDGPDLATITRMVEDAIAAESHGLEGPAFGDAQGLDAVTDYGEGDAAIRGAIDRLAGAGFETTLDMKEETWKQPKGGVGNQAAGAAFYVGWYSYSNFQDIFGEHGLAQGSIAWHIASGEAVDIWNPNGGWCINLMRRGAAVTIGPVREPYVAAFPHGDVFVEALLQGLTVADSYWVSLPHVSWAMVLLGDPLYRPFGVKPRPALLARAYASADANQILEHGKTSPLLVQVDCVGPAGSSTPAYKAKAEPEFGLAAAEGTVSIPALKAGQSVVVRVPSVTAGDDPTGMFRLRLEARADGEAPRRIVVEGRIGFSRLTGGLGPKSQMFVSPEGKELISGRPGRSALIDVASLRERPVNMPQGYGLTNAEFSPDGKHVAVTLLDPKKKQVAYLVTDDALRNAQGLPTGLQFLRWLGSDQVLIANQGGLISHSIGNGEDRVIGLPAGRTGNIIPGTEIQFAVTEDARVLIKNGSQPFQEVLRDVKPARFLAVANDLSLFGAVDAQKRLWVQKDLDGAPKVIAEGVERVLWGPISRRAVVQDGSGKSRLYDGRDGSWKDLGFLLESAWSPDEQQLLFVDAGSSSQPGYLSLLTGTSVERLCAMSRIGLVGKMVFSEDQTKAYLLATLAQQADVWMIALPQRAAGK